jgi:hypothetical protein
MRASRFVAGFLLVAAAMCACSRGKDSVPRGPSPQLAGKTLSAFPGVRATTVFRKTASVATPIPCPTATACVNIVAEGPPVTAALSEVLPPWGNCITVEIPFPIAMPSPGFVTAIPNPLQAPDNECVQTTISTVYTLSFPYPPPMPTCPPGASFGFWAAGINTGGNTEILASLICPGTATPSPSPVPLPSPSGTPSVTLTVNEATTTDADSVPSSIASRLAASRRRVSPCIEVTRR